MNNVRFKDTSCSQCGRSFGHGNSGYSHCSDHAHPLASKIQQEPIAWLIEGPDTDAEGWLTREIVLSEPADSLHPEAFVTPLHAGKVRFAGKFQAVAK